MSVLSASGYLLLSMCAVGFIAARKRPRLISPCLWALTSCFALLLYALLNDRFELRYVAAYSARDLPQWLKAASLWGGEEGGLLLLALICAAIAAHYRHSHPHCRDAMLMLAALFSAACLWWSPFAPSPSPPADGAGLNAHLLTVWMAVHLVDAQPRACQWHVVGFSRFYLWTSMALGSGSECCVGGVVAAHRPNARAQAILTQGLPAQAATLGQYL